METCYKGKFSGGKNWNIRKLEVVSKVMGNLRRRESSTSLSQKPKAMQNIWHDYHVEVPLYTLWPYLINTFWVWLTNAFVIFNVNNHFYSIHVWSKIYHEFGWIVAMWNNTYKLHEALIKKCMWYVTSGWAKGQGQIQSEDLKSKQKYLFRHLQPCTNTNVVVYNEVRVIKFNRFSCLLC